MIDAEEVKRIAGLARIEIPVERMDDFTRKLQQVIGYVALLNKLPTEGVDPLAQVTGLTDVLREDRPSSFPLWRELIESSPLPKERGQIKVKSVF